MSQALYRKYRPQTFNDLVGQNPIKITLQNEVEQDRVAHAYLFSGPRGVGKTTTARLLAKAVNCQDKKSSEPCNKCDFCMEFSSGRAMDLIEIDAASHTGVDNVRENIIENSRFTPQRTKYKVFIIDEVHMLSVSAFNALLKTLEEPPEYVIFILATTEIHRVPETIISRCQRFDFRRVSVDELVKRLQLIAKKEKITIEDSILENIAKRAEGSVRDVEVLLSQIMALGEKKITEETASLVIPRSDMALVIEFFRSIVQQDSPAAIALVNRLVEEGVNIQEFTKDLIEFLRKVLLLKVSDSLDEIIKLDLDKKVLTDIKKYISLISTDQVIKMLDTIISRSREIKFSSIIQLPLELAAVELCGVNKPEAESIKEKQKPDDDMASSAGQSDEKTATKGSDSMLNKQSKIQNFSQIVKIWPQILQRIKAHNHSISVSLKIGTPLKLKDNSLVVGFQHKFHADRLNTRNIRKIIEDIITEITGLKIKYQSLVVSGDELEKSKKEFTKATPKKEKDEEVWNQALQVFGGEVVEEEI
ncbi:DNA polymerase III subunit gamma/tau [Patescibacteria group bacterium]|nr:DNA polymerase III subunit gamma/tau [Patescibacteria group bacterium]MBU0963724.1 DNA polymerase III subunit gamma/tau [Patescibacteria group bacterium]